MHWWSLPGPRSFVEAINDDVRQGKSVLLSLPQNTPARLSAALKEALQGDFAWYAGSVDPQSDPISFLYDVFAPDAEPSRLRNEANLAREAGFENRVIWLEDLPAARWSEWRDFLIRYERVSRSIPEAYRTNFIVRTDGTGTHPDLPQEVGLSTRRWDGYLERRDMQIFTYACVPEQASGLETDLVAALVTVLGGWDPDLCEYLASFDLPLLAQPYTLLRDFACNRNWDFASSGLTDEVWAQGLWQTYLGENVPHTCYALALHGSRHLDSLIWKAEVAVLMPYIEQQRQKLIERYRHCFKIPHVTKTEVIEDVYDLEIGMIHWQLSQAKGLPRAALDDAWNLRKARNSLSHFSAVDLRVLLALCGRK
jgi:hypothetical protein